MFLNIIKYKIKKCTTSTRLNTYIQNNILQSLMQSSLYIYKKYTKMNYLRSLIFTNQNTEKNKFKFLIFMFTNTRKLYKFFNFI